MALHTAASPLTPAREVLAALQPNKGLTWTPGGVAELIAWLRNAQVRPQPRQPTPGCGTAMQVGLLCLGYCQCKADAGTEY